MERKIKSFKSTGKWTHQFGKPRKLLDEKGQEIVAKLVPNAFWQPPKRGIEDFSEFLNARKADSKK
ncbi:MAG: hypothetical protein EHM41_00025 [Chloroflexi bacterium]|nr:MAG: hypothetical protein EHM41_00025 [Chloroflexota bacterium]